jgi:ABC-type antimicrobial peptide transport system permease subunit
VTASNALLGRATHPGKIGIRRALGAGSTAVTQMIVIQGMRLALMGVVIGIASAFGLTRFIASLLFGVKALDPSSSRPSLILTAVALLAVWIPARRASRVDPVTALRTQ